MAFGGPGGFAVCCPLADYGALIDLLMTHPVGVALPGGNWPQIFNMVNGVPHTFPHIGVSFMTKHLSFWSRASNSPIRLPILDKVVYNTFIRPNRVPRWVDYVPYVTQLNADRVIVSERPGQRSITLSEMERQLFNWANPVPNSWVR